MSDPFTLLRIEPGFFLERAALDTHLRQALSFCHPDRFAGHSEALRREAEEKSCALTQAFADLKDPIKRAHCLLAHLGHTGDLPTMEAAFLAESMLLQEEIEEDPRALMPLLRNRLCEMEDFLEQAFHARDKDAFARHLGHYLVFKRLEEHAHAAATA